MYAFYIHQCQQEDVASLAEEDVVHLSFMTGAVKAVVVSITNASPRDVHHSLYNAAMDARGLS
jgi:hypothetical protein